MVVALLLLLLFASVLISIFLFYTLKQELISVERKMKLLATKVELSEVRSSMHSARVPRELQGSVDLYYRGHKATVDATFIPKVYR